MEIGPALPPHLAKKLSSSKKEKRTDDEQKQSNTAAGEERLLSLQTEDKSDSDEEESYGPALPPGFQKNKETVSRTRVIGPMRPQFDTTHSLPITTNASKSSDDDEDGDIIGPRPPTSAEIDAGLERTKMDIEARSQAKRDQMSGKRIQQKTEGNQKKDSKPKRETWMTELPPDLSKNFGLGPRKFRNRALEIGDQSVWTDTPTDKARKSKEGDKGSKRSSSDDGPVRTAWEIARDQQMNSQVEHYNKRHRGESLMDMHTKKLEKQKQEDKNKPVERRPFDRDKDLNVPGMSDGQKKSIIHKSKELGSRFHHSKSGSSFL